MEKIKKEWLRNLPDNLFKQTKEFISDHTVALVGYSDSDIPIKGAIASGTLVKINSKFGVLTAKHVWCEFKKDKDIKKISFSVVGYHHYISIRIDYLNPIFPNNNADICFFELHAPILNEIKAKRSFYTISEERFPSIENVREHLWCTVGFPKDFQDEKNRIINPLHYHTHVTDYTIDSNSGIDLIKLEIKYESIEDKLPYSLVGMSGGGIWYFHIYYNDDSGNLQYFLNQKSTENFLFGVNFWQSELKEKKRILTGVGPLVIYKQLLDLID